MFNFFIQGCKELEIVIPRSGLDTTNDISRKIWKFLTVKAKYNIVSKVFQHSKFVAEFSNFESKFPQKILTMKIAVLDVRKGQITPEQWALNGHQNMINDSKFWDMMNCFGNKIDLSTWEGFRGEMGRNGETYFELWHPQDGHGAVQVIYHLSCLVDEEEHRRLIGNDIAVLIYVEEGAQFCPRHLKDLGKMHQIYVVVQPFGKLWRTSFFSTTSITEFPPLPPSYLVSLPALKQIVLTKFYNGLTMTQYCPPMDRLFYLPRQYGLDTVLAKHYKAYDGIMTLPLFPSPRCSCDCYDPRQHVNVLIFLYECTALAGDLKERILLLLVSSSIYALNMHNNWWICVFMKIEPA
eukprot:TRINITY_DN3977_c1_g1_i6.p1 TRINITY_DN3977_c1_g1~~TRINITY_DN3977_c1_g1_i6.p1  ORF type:complete len:351 (-),score=45.23 TRINITY_DN3977_c1_g1_i6:246-1298(-)